MSLGNQSSLGNLDAIKKLDFDPSITNYLSGSTTIGQALLALDEALDTGLENQNEASEITYDNVSSALISTNCQGAIDELDLRADQNETDITNLEGKYAITNLNSASDVKNELFGLSDTNNYSDTEKTKVSNNQTNILTLQTNYTNTNITSAAAVKTQYESNADTNAFTDAEKSKLTGIETSATADQTASEIKIAYESNADTNEFSDALLSKLNAIEASATADQDATEVPFTSGGSLISTDVAGALDELDTKVVSVASSGVSVEAWATHTGDHRLDNYPAGISGTSGTLDSNADGGVGTAAAIEYSSNGPLAASFTRGTFTAPSDGTYVFKYAGDQTTNGANRVHHYRLIKNGSTEVAVEEYTTNGPRTTGNEVFWIGDLSTSDTLAVHLGANHTASHIPESLFYTVTKILSVTNGVPMESQQVFYDNVTTTQNVNNGTPVSIYSLDSNFKLTLDPGKWLISYHFPVQGSSAVTTWLASSLSSGTAQANAVSSCLHNSRSLHSSSVIVTPGVQTDYTVWALPLSGTGTSEYFNTQIDAVEPKDIPYLNAFRLSAPTVGDSGSVSYDNTISGLTATNVKTAIDEVEGRIDTLEAAPAPATSLDGLTDAVQNNNNVGLGDNALVNITSGTKNVAIGTSAGQLQSSQFNSIFVGYNCGVSSNAGQLTMIGANANASSASQSVIIGTSAGNGALSSINNILIGRGCDNPNNATGIIAFGTNQTSGNITNGAFIGHNTQIADIQAINGTTEIMMYDTATQQFGPLGQTGSPGEVLSYTGSGVQWQPQLIQENFYSEQLTTSQTTSNSYTTFHTLNFTPSVAGDYLVNFTCEVRDDVGTGLDCNMRYDTTNHVKVREFSPAAVNGWGTFSGTQRFTVTAASHDVDIRFRASTGGNNVRIRDSKISVVQL